MQSIITMTTLNFPWVKCSAGKHYEVVKTIRWHPVQTPWITLILSINAINNHNDNISFPNFAESRSFLPPMSQIQCWQTLPLLVVILWSGENHQMASCANSMNNLNPIHQCNQLYQWQHNFLKFCRIKVLLASLEWNPVLANTTIENTFVKWHSMKW
jgi:hypothetical protein